MISTTSEYALRALSCLARSAEGQALLGKDLALLADVPSNYLAKILLDLKRAGIVQATRGTGGGYQLAKSPEDVSLADVVEVFEGPCCAPRCLLGGSRECSDTTACAFHAKWREVRRAYACFLQTTTLDEVVTTPADADPSASEAIIESPTPSAPEETIP